MKYYGSQAGIREIRDLKLHTARKTHETYLTAMGINDMTISLHMGHTIDVALRYYIGGTLTQEDINKIKAILGDIIGGIN
jgi:integrase